MPGRIVLFGATGYAGRLTAEALLGRGLRPVLAARSAEKLESLAAELDPSLELAVADSARPESISALVERGDVLITTVGPFARFGEPALQAALAARATYIDSAGEPAFVRRVFERFGPAAERAGCGLLTAFGYDYVPGNLAGALALREADRPAALVDIGYFVTGRAALAALSGGTLASLAGAIAEPGFAFRDGHLVSEPNGRHVQSFELRGKQASAISIGASEHFALPRLEPALHEVGVYLGWAGPLSRLLQGLSIPTSVVARAPLTGPALRALTGGLSGGPDAASRARIGSHIVAVARDAAGRRLSEVRLDGQNPYAFTAAILAWGAERATEPGLEGTGALGPVDGFGLDALEQGCREAGLARV
ncbi:MAG: trans-acting enoyl reductase family protein [Gaiellaceae bacterium]